jgi:hypothetical protein
MSTSSRAQRVAIVVVSTIALAVFGYGLARMVTAKPITEPRHVTMLGRTLEQAGCLFREPTFVIGDRLVVWCDRAFAWIEPTSATAKVAWPLPPEDKLANWTVVAIAPRADGSFAVAVQGYAGHNKLALGIAGRDGWLSPPVVVADLEGTIERAIALAWIDGRAELVCATLSTLPPVAYSLAPGERTPKRFELPYKHCTDGEYKFCRRVVAAVPDEHGWKTVTIHQLPQLSQEPYRYDVELIAKDGSTATPPELQWWFDPKTGSEDRTSIPARGSSATAGSSWMVAPATFRSAVPSRRSLRSPRTSTTCDGFLCSVVASTSRRRAARSSRSIADSRAPITSRCASTCRHRHRRWRQLRLARRRRAARVSHRAASRSRLLAQVEARRRDRDVRALHCARGLVPRDRVAPVSVGSRVALNRVRSFVPSHERQFRGRIRGVQSGDSCAVVRRDREDDGARRLQGSCPVARCW